MKRETLSSMVDPEPVDRFPLTYAECRARFLQSAGLAGATLEPHVLEAKGPEGERLTIDVARLGDARPDRVLVVMSGVHGIEGYAGSAIQTSDLGSLSANDVPKGCAVLYIHAVNPFGMAWWRRQNESNVDLNRNWVDFDAPLPENAGYRELHPWLCPDVVDDDTDADFLAAAARFIETHGYSWVKEAVTVGQYEFEDGLYYGGHRREASTKILASIAKRHLTGCDTMCVVDLHTGHGPNGACTLLSGEPAGSDGDRMIGALFPGESIERTAGNPAATTPHKRGQLTLGMCAALPHVRSTAVTLEIGTADDTTMIMAERREHWLHRKGDMSTALGGQIAWAHRVASIPDDRAWQTAAVEHGRRVLSLGRARLFEQHTGATS